MAIRSIPGERIVAPRFGHQGADRGPGCFDGIQASRGALAQSGSHAGDEHVGQGDATRDAVERPDALGRDEEGLGRTATRGDSGLSVMATIAAPRSAAHRVRRHQRPFVAADVDGNQGVVRIEARQGPADSYLRALQETTPSRS